MAADPVIIIDGYNLMHHLLPARITAAPGGLERGRQVVLARVSALVDSPLRQRTVVVFDAGEMSPDGGRTGEQPPGGVLARFAAGYAEADELIEEMIQRHSAPRSLTVVSGDRRLIRAARRRGARALDCASWLDECESRGSQHSGAGDSGQPDRSSRPVDGAAGDHGADDREYWLRVFGPPDDGMGGNT